MFGYIGYHLILYFKRLMCTILLLLAATVVQAETLYVVVSNNLRGRAFSPSEIKRILLGEITSLNNGRVHLIYPSYSSNAIKTLSRFVGKGSNARDLKAYWSKMIFTGRGNPPDTADNDAELKKFLEEDNAIGVATQSAGMNVVYTIND